MGSMTQPKRFGSIQDEPDLLADELGNALVVLPLSQEQLSEEWIEGLLFVAILFASAGILLFQCCQEPL